MAIDYRYHIGSFVAVFVALLLGILIGIGLAPNPDELRRQVSALTKEYEDTRHYKDAEVKTLEEEARQANEVAREAAPAVIGGRLQGRRVALVIASEVSSELSDNLRAALAQAGADTVSTSTITRSFATMPQALRDKVCKQLLLYPPAGAPIRPILSRSLAQDISGGKPKLIPALRSSGLLASTPGSRYDVPVGAVVLVGGMTAPDDPRPEQIDLPLIEELTRLGVRVVACEESTAKVSCVPAYKEQNIATVDNVDTLPGRISLVLALEGATGHFGVKATADSGLLPAIPAPPKQP